MKDSFLKQGIHFSIDKLQTRETMCLRWLMGSRPKSLNREDLEKAVQNFLFPADFTGEMIEPFEVKCRVQVICITKSTVLGWKTATRAAHLYVAVDNNWRPCMRFLCMFSNRNELGSPPVQELWFVPSIINFRIV